MKKQTITLITFAFLASTFFFSCKKNKTDNYGNMVFDSLQINKTAYLFNDTAAPNCNLIIDYTYPVKASNQTLVDSVNVALLSVCFGKEYERLSPESAIDSFTQAYVRDYQTDLGTLYLEDKEKNPQRETLGAWYSYYSNIEAYPLKNNPEILVYQIDISSYTGGAHGIYNTYFLNFNIQTGRIIRLNDLFIPHYQKELNELLVSRLMKNIGVSGRTELEEKAYLQDTEMYPTENFRMMRDSIVFFYNVYEIAPYSSGITEITLSYKELKDILKKDGDK